ncbi:unnamed protein product [Phytophthora fragariaefolia]|uniref:Unnamed protein product n=1 Tax=Phytophthora fragariaefolia TaxID=1490495 RepID=A0A9W6WTR7_9STRA|nr:unnamed protein product [Phytophthora fragariaefolia]
MYQECTSFKHSPQPADDRLGVSSFIINDENPLCSSTATASNALRLEWTLHNLQLVEPESGNRISAGGSLGHNWTVPWNDPLAHSAHHFFVVAITAASDFGYKSSGGSWVITSGDGLTITMDQDTCDITSMLLNNSELQYSAKNTHVNSGLGSVTSSIKTLEDSTIQVTCKTTGIEQTSCFAQTRM